MAVLDHDLAVGGVDMTMNIRSKRRLGDDEVHLHEPGRGHIGMRHLIADRLGGDHPLGAEELELLCH